MSTRRDLTIPLEAPHYAAHALLCGVDAYRYFSANSRGHGHAPYGRLGRALYRDDLSLDVVARNAGVVLPAGYWQAFGGLLEFLSKSGFISQRNTHLRSLSNGEFEFEFEFSTIDG